MEIDKAKERYLKLKALAERGVGGERDTAKKKIDSLLLKYGVTIEELEEETLGDYIFSYKGEIEKKLLAQCIYKALGKDFSIYKVNNTRNKLGVQCTKAQKIEIELDFDFYKKALYNELDVFIQAFVTKNSIFPSDGSACNENYTRNEKDERALMMSRGIEKYTRVDLLE